MSKKKTEVVDELFCLCRRSFDENDEDQMMIECESCKDWLHGRCVGITIRQAADIEIYICPRCINGQKQIIYKEYLNNHRYDFSDPDGHKKPMQAGTKAFVEKLLTRAFPDACEQNIVQKINNGGDLTVEYLTRNGFKSPLLVEKKHDLQFTMPDSSEISLGKIEEIVGSDYEIDVIDVERQETFPMKINELNEYFTTWPRTRTYNLISFEISKTNLSMQVTAPKVVYDISWASNNVWPRPIEPVEPTPSESQKSTKLSNYLEKPEVQKYCLISAANSYTDFHIDFGGSTVWYHIVKGDKIFYLIEPTDENIKIYEKWLCVKNHSEIFLGDRVKKCFRFEVKEGNTIFLPTGWIHAVYTPYDSLVFGGNFLHSHNIPLQLKIYEMEVRLKTPEKFRFPSFETFQWYALKHHEKELKKSNSNRENIGEKHFKDLKHLRDQLKKWVGSKNFYELHDYYIPRNIDCEKLISMMNRELSKAEILLKSGPPKIEQSSSENSLKIKLKLNPNNLASSTSTLVCDNNNNNKKSSKPKKEVLTYKPSANVMELKIDEPVNQIEKPRQNLDEKKDQPPIKLIMKLPKVINECTDQLEQKLDLPAVVSTTDPVIKSIKLKIKTQDMITIASNIKEDDELAEVSSSESEAEFKNEDDELMNELKNSFQDNDFVYPSLNRCGTTARTAKKAKQVDTAPKLETFVTASSSSEPQEEKQTRKRKLKPHAAQYLVGKQENSEKTELPKETDTESNAKSPAEAEPKLPDTDTNNSQADSKTENSEDDREFQVDDEDDLDYDQEFKIKCEHNLRLSKKLKTKSVKHQKKLENLDTDGTGSRATDPTSKTSKDALNKKTKKKGYATTKQRLGKLLKLNRLVNI